MKRVLIFIIEIYQRIVSVVLFNLGLKTKCRFSPTCSEYSKRTILKEGIAKGGYLSFVRVLKCQPFYQGK